MKVKISQVLNHIGDAYSTLEELKRKVKEIDELREFVKEAMNHLEEIPDEVSEIEFDVESNT
jgi:archaellum component FlaC